MSEECATSADSASYPESDVTASSSQVSHAGFVVNRQSLSHSRISTARLDSASRLPNPSDSSESVSFAPGQHSTADVQSKSSQQISTTTSDSSKISRSVEYVLCSLPQKVVFALFRSTVRQSRPIKACLKCLSVCAYVRTYVRPSVPRSTKSFFDFNEIWHVRRGR